MRVKYHRGDSDLRRPHQRAGGGENGAEGHSESEIAGYHDVPDIIHTRHVSMKPNERTILRMFSVIGSYSDGPTGYKARDNAIIDVLSDGTRSVNSDL